jgi:hypothetical protein
MKRIAIVLVLAVIGVLLCSCHSGGTLQRRHVSTDQSSLRSTSAEEGRHRKPSRPDALHGEHRLGLLLAAHGSPRPQWNEQLVALESEVRALLNVKDSSPFRMIRVGMMEFAEPTIASVLQDMELHGVQEVYVLPLLIAPSSHSVFDLPAILGLYSDSRIRDQLQAEGNTIAATNMRVTLGPTLNYGAVLKEVMLDRARDLSREPQSEGIVLLAHGDLLFAPFWESLCQEIGFFVCAHTGIPTFDFAFVEMGQTFTGC